ncbi:MAG TPA: acyl-CoA thioesterase domain-containing protein [Acidimicrobiales bacterium]|nr:acyl-CoA thioesterase domain-containing protein [Acidimicrobiales bacterium]
MTATATSSLDQLLCSLGVGSDPGRSPAASHAGRVLGGQMLAHAVIAAAATVDDGKDLHSLHASFVRAGTSGAAMAADVTRLRDGRSTATRQVAVVEEGEPLLVAVASFGRSLGGPTVTLPAPAAPPPEEVPTLQEWAAGFPSGRHWIEQPPAVELRLPEPPSFLSGVTSTSARWHWMRLPRSVGDGHALNAALLAYASDFFLMDMVFRMHPEELGPGRANGFSLDHAVWFHRPVRFDEWHLYTQEAVALVGERGLARGGIYDSRGRLVASVAQEVLLRLGPTP